MCCRMTASPVGGGRQRDPPGGGPLQQAPALQPRTPSFRGLRNTRVVLLERSYLGADASVLVAALWGFVLWGFLVLAAAAEADGSAAGGVASAASTGPARRIKLRTGTTCLNIEG